MLKLISRIEEGFCAGALLLTALVLFANVILRYVFHSGLSWAEELIRYLMIWITFIGGSVCVRRGAHIRMDFLMTMLSPRVAELLTRFVYFLSGAFCLGLLWYSRRLVAFTIRLHQTSPAMGIPMWVPYMAIPVGSVLMAWEFFRVALSGTGTSFESAEKNAAEEEKEELRG